MTDGLQDEVGALVVGTNAPGSVTSEGRHMSETSVAPAPVAQLAAALAKAQGAITGATKSKTNPHFRSSYADLAEVWDACRPALAAHGLSVVQMPSANGPRVTVTTVLLHESGESLSSALTMEAAQDTPQAIGSCITYARRYALASMVGVAPEDDDGNAASAPGTRERTTRAPGGFDVWFQAWQETATLGIEALMEAWSVATPECRAYAQDHHRDVVVAAGKRAREVAQ
jgi:hypothetical protein